MQFIGSGIGHKVTDYIQPSTPVCIHDKEPNVHDKDVMPHNTQDHAQARDRVDMDGDLEEADIDEEVDYWYVKDLESEDKDSKNKEVNDNDDKYDIL